jgi:hypothetical protein
MSDCACFFVLDVVPGKSLCSGRITGYPEVPKKCGSVRIGDDTPGTQTNCSSMSALPSSASRTGHPRSGQMEDALFTPESFGGWDGDGVAGGQQAGEECAESEERGGCEQAA